GIAVFYILPLSIFCLSTTVDLSFLPAPILAAFRFFGTILFMHATTVMSLIFLLRNPTRQKLANSIKNICLCTS
ncbi:hypothetical protein PFISCL1PPCAC_13865, partial [Pristionchus fissidentatus]